MRPSSWNFKKKEVAILKHVGGEETVMLSLRMVLGDRSVTKLNRVGDSPRWFYSKLS